jgi:hypothetical protein
MTPDRCKLVRPQIQRGAQCGVKPVAGGMVELTELFSEPSPVQASEVPGGDPAVAFDRHGENALRIRRS